MEPGAPPLPDLVVFCSLVCWPPRQPGTASSHHPAATLAPRTHAPGWGPADPTLLTLLDRRPGTLGESSS
eukprot:15477002-Alexandrium_andersonii.AAC.1